MTNKKIAKLIRENYPSNYKGYRFITLVQFGEEKYLTIVDRLTEKTLSVYMLDMCAPKGVDEERIISIANEWFYSDRRDVPISFEFTRQGYGAEASEIHRTFNVDFIKRVVGPLPEIHRQKATVKRKKRKKFT